MTNAHPDSRLRELARCGALDAHVRAMRNSHEMSYIAADPGHVFDPPAADWGFSTCPHPDCVLVRAAVPVEEAAPPVCKTCRDSGFVAYWDGSAYAGEGCPDCPSGPEAASPGPVAGAVPAPQWQPIETAPRPSHGRRKVIDVWCVTDDHESAKFYFGNTMSGVKDHMTWQGRVNEVYWLDGAWRPATGLRMHGLTVTPTHWMPLPSPPRSEQDETQEHR